MKDLEVNIMCFDESNGKIVNVQNLKEIFKENDRKS